MRSAGDGAAHRREERCKKSLRKDLGRSGGSIGRAMDQRFQELAAELRALHYLGPVLGAESLAAVAQEPLEEERREVVPVLCQHLNGSKPGGRIPPLLKPCYGSRPLLVAPFGWRRAASVRKALEGTTGDSSAHQVELSEAQ